MYGHDALMVAATRREFRVPGLDPGDRVVVEIGDSGTGLAGPDHPAYRVEMPNGAYYPEDRETIEHTGQDWMAPRGLSTDGTDAALSLVRHIAWLDENETVLYWASARVELREALRNRGERPWRDVVAEVRPAR